MFRPCDAHQSVRPPVGLVYDVPPFVLRRSWPPPGEMKTRVESLGSTTYMPHSLPPPWSAQVEEPVVWMMPWSWVAHPMSSGPEPETPRLISWVAVRLALRSDQLEPLSTVR